MISSTNPDRIFLAILASWLLGCQESDREITECKPIGDPFQISAVNYSTNYYFVDTSYVSLYEQFFLSDPTVVDPALQILETEVWVSRLGALPNVYEIHGKAYVHLPAYRGGYPNSLRTGPDEPGNIEEGPFFRLDRSQYETLGDGYPGIIRLRDNVSDYGVIAIAYRRADGAQFGEFARDVLDSAFVASGIPILLKLVKPVNLLSNGPAYRDPWRLLVKSIYPIGYSGVIRTQFQLDVFEQTGATPGQHSILGKPLLAVLGLDRYTSDGAPGEDGVFDYRPGRTIDQIRGDIILPYVRPFDNGIRKYFASIGQPISPASNVLLPQLYDLPTTALARRLASKYVFEGSALHQ
jgi:hypothetical protein